MLAAGDKIGQYTVVRPLGKGGMGAVYLARHETLDAYFALKVLDPAVAARNGQFVQRFLREAKLCCRLRHPNLVAVHDAGREETTGLHYLVMDYAPGGSLREKLDAARGPLPVPAALRIAGEIAAALEAADAFHLVHRDIKPENIMFGENGEAKLADLGVAKSAIDGDSLVTMADAVFGTPAYMSPEQACDSKTVDARADLYSLGIVLFEMLAGRRPYDGERAVNVIAQVLSSEPVPDVRTYAPGVPPEIAALVAGLCDKRISRRIPSAKALLEALRKIGGAAPATTSVVPVPARRPYAALLVAGALVAVLLAGGAGWFAFRQVRSSRARVPCEPQVTPGPAPAAPAAPTVEEKSGSEPEAVEPKTAEPAPRVSSPEKPAWRPPPAPTLVKASVPVQPAEEASVPASDVLKEGDTVVLGGRWDDPGALRKRLSSDAFVAVETPARLAATVDRVCARRPKRVYLKLIDDAARSHQDVRAFEDRLRAAANRLTDAGIPFELVLEPETPETHDYNEAVRTTGNLFSYGVRAP